MAFLPFILFSIWIFRFSAYVDPKNTKMLNLPIWPQDYLGPKIGLHTGKLNLVQTQLRSAKNDIINDVFAIYYIFHLLMSSLMESTPEVSLGAFPPTHHFSSITHTTWVAPSPRWQSAVAENTRSLAPVAAKRGLSSMALTIVLRRLGATGLKSNNKSLPRPVCGSHWGSYMPSLACYTHLWAGPL